MRAVPSARANGLILDYERFGDDAAEPCLLISGLGVQMIRWAVPFCKALAAEGYRVIRFDNRDVGLSTHFDGASVPNLAAVAAAVACGERPDVPYVLDDMAADLVGLLDVLGIERAHLVGRSMGGMIAQLVASRWPHRVLSLVSIMSSSGNPALPSATPAVLAMLRKPVPSPTQDEAAFLAQSLAFARVIASPGYPFDDDAYRRQILAEAARAWNPAGAGRQIAALAATGDCRARLAAITAPTLVIHGADDPLIPMAAGQDVAAHIGGADLRIIEGMGHDLPPELFAAVISAIVGNARRRPLGSER